MTFCSTYIGDLDDPSFSFEEGNWHGNIPRQLGEPFPGPLEHYNRQFHTWVAEAGITWKQTDFGGWVARVDKAQLLEFIRYCYGSSSDESVKELTRFVEELEDKTYGLVAEEF